MNSNILAVGSIFRCLRLISHEQYFSYVRHGLKNSVYYKGDFTAYKFEEYETPQFFSSFDIETQIFIEK